MPENTAPRDQWLNSLDGEWCSIDHIETETLCLSTEQIQPGKRQCNVPMCLNPDLEGQPLRMRGEWSHRISDCEKLKTLYLSITESPSRCGNLLFGSSLKWLPPLLKHLQGAGMHDLSEHDQQEVLPQRDFPALGPRKTSLVSLSGHLLLIPQSALEHTPLGPSVFLPIGVSFPYHPESASPGMVQLICAPSTMLRSPMNGFFSAF